MTSSDSYDTSLHENGRAKQDAVFLELERAWRAPEAGASSNALTCDVEDYFQVSAFEHLITRDSWHERKCRIPRNVDRILELYSEADVSGTFFTLGWVAEHYPEVVTRIASEGHEIASHGYQHIRVWDQKPREFREDIRKTKAILEDLSGHRVRGYRAASWSLDKRTPWAHDIMAEEGHAYSSSVYPISHDHYGIPDAPGFPFFLKGSGLLEIPATTSKLMGRNIPAAGGGYFRLMPLAVSSWLIERGTRQLGSPAIFYFHPWELDPKQPRISGAGAKARFRHYLNLERFEPRFRSLLKRFDWDRMDRVYLGAEV